jgi:hypothetical protein
MKAPAAVAPCAAPSPLLSTPSGWTPGSPPKDGQLYIAIGNVSERDEYGGYSDPFLSHVRWRSDEGFVGWLDERDLALVTSPKAEVHIHYWCRLPGGVA